MNRRNILVALMGLGGTMLSGVLMIPALLASLGPALNGRRATRWRSAGPLKAFPIHSVAQAVVKVRRGDWGRSLDAKAVYVWRKSAEEVVVYSRNCTDLSCPVRFDPGSECFFCPCHGGIFAKDGRPLAGPPREPLYRYANRVRDGVLEIDLASLPPMT